MFIYGFFFITFVNNIIVVLIIFACSGLVSEGLYTKSGSYDVAQIMYGLIIMNVIVIVSLTLLKLVKIFDAPLGNDVVGFPQHYYTARFEKDTKVIFDGVYNAVESGLIKTVRK